MIAAFGQISGGHFNPAVTFGLACARKFPTAAVIPYWIAQLIGGFIAVLLAMLVYTNDVKTRSSTNPGAGVPTGAPARRAHRGFPLRLGDHHGRDRRFGTVEGRHGAPRDRRLHLRAAVTIGPTSGGSFNPARSIDPAIWALEFKNLWIYIVGPLIGARSRVGLSMAIRDEVPEPTRSAKA
jgi:glycerol uptake facilitator-like aquaporin